MGQRVVIENDVKGQLGEFAERNGLELNCASFTRLKTSKSALDKIDRIKEQLSEAIPLGKGKFADCYETLDSLRRALIPTDIMEEFLWMKLICKGFMLKGIYPCKQD